MKGRLNSTILLLVALNALALFAVLGLAYGAGARSGGLSILEFGQLSGAAGMELLGAFVIASGIALLLWIMLTGRVSKPVKELTDFSERLANGDYRARAEVDSTDDFGVIAENFSRASEKLSKAVVNQEAQELLQRSVAEFLAVTHEAAHGDLTLRGKVTNDALGNVVGSVNHTLDDFVKVLERTRSAALEVSSSANQISASAEEMANGATQQDQEITRAASAVEEIAASMKQVSNKAEASAEAARRALDAAEQGKRALRDTLEGTQRVRDSVQATAKKIKSLGDRSLEIFEVINVIHDITEQSNLLVLNAAIESRAGEAGRSSSVVADEVRGLAEHSRTAARSVLALIRAIQAETNEAVVAMEESTREMDAGARLAEQAGKALEAVSTVVRQSAELVQQISLASEQQAHGGESFAKAMQTISSITRQTSHGARQTARTVEQMVKLSEQLNEALSQFRTSVLPAPAPPRAETATSLRLIAGQGGARS